MIVSYTLNDTSTPFVTFCTRPGFLEDTQHHPECKTAAGGRCISLFFIALEKPLLLWIDLLKRI